MSIFALYLYSILNDFITIEKSFLELLTTIQIKENKKINPIQLRTLHEIKLLTKTP